MNTNIIIGVASDHAGFSLKEHILNTAPKVFSDYSFVDYGCNSSLESVDYPEFAQKLCKDIISKKLNKGILICGSGIGMSIAANKFHKEIRAALCYNIMSARLSREHNDTNVLCLGNWFVTPKLCDEILETWFKAEFQAGRHEKRIKLL